MKKILLLAFGALIALPALSQIGSIPAERKFAIIEIFDNDAYIDSFKVKKLITDVVLVKDGTITKRDTEADTATLYLAEDGVTKYIGTTTWHTNTLFDTTWTVKETYDDAAGAPSRWVINNISLATNSTKPGVYNKSFTFVKVTSSPSSAKTTFTGDRVEFFSERYQGHGLVKILIDGQQVSVKYQNDQPWVTDFSRMQPTFYYVFPKDKFDSPPTQHTLELQTDPGNQYIVDMIRVVNMTLTPRIKR